MSKSNKNLLESYYTVAVLILLLCVGIVCEQQYLVIRHEERWERYRNLALKQIFSWCIQWLNLFVSIMSFKLNILSSCLIVILGIWFLGSRYPAMYLISVASTNLRSDLFMAQFSAPYVTSELPWLYKISTLLLF